MFFLISQLALNKFSSDKRSSYAIGSGIVLYSVLYIYVLFYKDDYKVFFHKTISYLVTVDLLLSSLWFFKIRKEQEQEMEKMSIVSKENIGKLNDFFEESDYDSDGDTEVKEVEINTDENYDLIMQHFKELEKLNNDPYNKNIAPNKLNDFNKLSTIEEESDLNSSKSEEYNGDDSHEDSKEDSHDYNDNDNDNDDSLKI